MNTLLILLGWLVVGGIVAIWFGTVSVKGRMRKR